MSPRMMRRMARTAATTAVVVGTAGAVAGHQQKKAAQQQAGAQQQPTQEQQLATPQQAGYEQAMADQQVAAPAPRRDDGCEDHPTAKDGRAQSSGHFDRRGVRRGKSQDPSKLTHAQFTLFPTSSSASQGRGVRL